MANHDDDDEEQLELESFLERGRQLQFVNNLRTGKLEGVAYKQPGAEDWQELPIEGGSEGHVFRETATNLVTGLITRELPGIAPPTDLDSALSTVTAEISPRKIAGKLANAAAQALAHHFGLSLIAHAVGKVTEQIVTSMPFPSNPIDMEINTASIGTVAYDLDSGQLTATAEDFFINEIPEIVSDPGTPEWIIHKLRYTHGLKPNYEIEGLPRLRRAAESPEISPGHPEPEAEEPEIELRAKASPQMLRHTLSESSRDSGGLPKPRQQLPAPAPKRPKDPPGPLHPGAKLSPNRLRRPGGF